MENHREQLIRGMRPETTHAHVGPHRGCRVAHDVVSLPTNHENSKAEVSVLFLMLPSRVMGHAVLR